MPTGTPDSARWWETRWFALLAIALAAVPLLWPQIPPLNDVPGHMGRYRVMLGTDADVLGQWYRFQWKPIGYLGVDLLVAALAPLVGLEPAVKAIVIAIPVLTATGILWLSREAHGRVQPMALLALPFAYNLAVQWGFLNYTLAMALVLNAFALWLRLGRLERIWLRAAIFVPLAWAIWFAHLFGWLMLGLLAFSAELTLQRSRGRGWVPAGLHAALACLPLAPPAAMFLAWRPDGGSAGSDWFAGLPYKPGYIAMALRDRWRWFDVASLLLVALLLYRAIRDRRFGHAPAVATAALAVSALFVAMPYGSAYADMRIAPYAIILALIAIRAGDVVPAREKAILAMIGLAFFAVRIAANTVSTTLEDRVWRDHLAMLDHVPRGSRLVSFVNSRCDQPWRNTRLSHLPAMAVVRRASFSNDQYDLHATALLTVVAPGLQGFRGPAGFAIDPSQLVVNSPCPESPEFRTLNQALTELPRDRFDMIWLIDAPPLGPDQMSGLRIVASNRTDLLLAVEHRLPEPPKLP